MTIQNDLAFVFPGQGSQTVGMLADLDQQFSLVGQNYRHASEILGYDLWPIVCNGPEEKINYTVITQPALLIAGYCVWQIWQQLSDKKPTLLAGHSLGEYTALLCSGVLSFADAVKLVAERGRLMQEAVPDKMGAMAAIIGLDEPTVMALCEQAAGKEVVAPANFNAIGQVVIGGHSAAVARVMQLAERAGAKLVVKINMSVPSHCVLIKPAAEKLAVYLQNIPFSMPKIPVLNNVDVTTYHEPRAIKDALVRQLYHPVRWVETIQTMRDKGINKIVECGPGKVLSGLIKRIDRNIKTYTTDESENLQTAVQNI